MIRNKFYLFLSASLLNVLSVKMPFRTLYFMFAFC
jgi:hypothetical protein